MADVKKNERSAIKELAYTLVIDDCDVVNRCDRDCVKTIAIRILLGTLKTLLALFCVVFIVFPLIYKFSYKLQQSVVFLNFVQWPRNPEFSNPSKYGLEGVRNFYITTNDGIQLGVWHILPENLKHTPNTTSDEVYENLLDGNDNIVIYNHGNSGHRIAPHRVELYKLLRKHFHVIAYDYRSYGDSSYENPTEDGLVSDSIFVYKWILNRTNANIFVWGHSLGTAISTHSLSILKNDGIRPAGLVLEAPFNNMREEISEHPLSRFFKNLPWFSYTVVEPMQANNLRFESDKFILNVDCPILIIHAEDDKVVPYKLGRKLYKTALTNRAKHQGEIEFRGFSSKFSYGHKFLCRAPELDSVIRLLEKAKIWYLYRLNDVKSGTDRLKYLVS